MEESSLIAFVEWCNTMYSTIKFTHQANAHAIKYLNTIVSKTINNCLAIKTFSKKADRNSYLQYESYHPPHLRNNLPYGQFLRMQCNCTLPQDYKSEGQSLSRQLQNKGYLAEIFSKARERADHIERETFFQKQKDCKYYMCYAV